MTGVQTCALPIYVTGGDLTLGQTNTAATLNARTVSLAATGNIVEANGTITAGTLVSPSAGTLELNGANMIGALGDIAATGNVSITDDEALTVLGTVAAGSRLTLTVTGGDLQIGTSASAGALNAGTVSLSDSGAITEQNGTIGATVLTIPTAGTVALGGANAIGTLDAAASTGNFSLTDGQALTVLGSVSAGPTLALNVTGDLTLGQTNTAATLNAGTVSLAASGAIS